jgi:DnaJ-class molecular chaperone
MDCPTCHGNGEMACTECADHAKQETTSCSCPVCQGRKVIPCVRCAGSGYID